MRTIVCMCAVGLLWTLGLPVASAQSDSGGGDDAGSDGPTSVAVFKLEGPADKQRLRDALTEVIRDEVATHSSYKLVNDRPVALDDVVVVLGCSSPTSSCMKKAAEQFGAELLVFGKIEANINGSDRADVRLFDARRGRYVRSFGQVIAEPGGPYGAFDKKVGTLLRTEKQRKAAQLVVSANVQGATVTVDGQQVGLTPMTKKGLKPGRHTILVEHPDYEPWSTDVDVAKGAQVKVQAPMDKKVDKKVDEKVSEEVAEKVSEEVDENTGGQTVEQAESAAAEAEDSQSEQLEQPELEVPPEFADSMSGGIDKVGPWVAIGAGALTLGGSGLAWMGVKQAEEDLVAWRRDPRNWQQTQQVDGCVGEECEILSRGERAETTQRVLLGVGSASMAGGLLWLLLRGNGDKGDGGRAKAQGFDVMVGPASVGARWSW